MFSCLLCNGEHLMVNINYVNTFVVAIAYILERCVSNFPRTFLYLVLTECICHVYFMYIDWVRVYYIDYMIMEILHLVRMICYVYKKPYKTNFQLNSYLNKWNQSYNNTYITITYRNNLCIVFYYSILVIILWSWMLLLPKLTKY